MKLAWIAGLLIASVCASPQPEAAARAAATQTILPSDARIWYEGRWDSVPSTWWPGSGFKLAFARPPTSMVINVGTRAPATPPITVSARFGTAGDYVTLNLTAGANALPLTSLGLFASAKAPVVFDLRTQFEDGSARLELASIELDAGARLTNYEHEEYVFEFIGDSLTAGYLCPRGVTDNWSFLTGDYFRAEHNHIAQSGACLTDADCWGNPRGMDYLYFRTQNTAYETLNGNVTTPWDFRKYRAAPTHVFINLGTNDRYWGYNGTAFESTYITFLHELRRLYPTQPIFIMSPWGYPEPTGVVPYFNTEDAAVLTGVHDKNVHLINGTGWIEYGDTYPDYTHPTPNGHAKVAYHTTDYLLSFGLKAPN